MRQLHRYVELKQELYTKAMQSIFRSFYVPNLNYGFANTDLIYGFAKQYKAVLHTLLMMAAEPMFSKRPVLRFTVASFNLLFTLFGVHSLNLKFRHFNATSTEELEIFNVLHVVNKNSIFVFFYQRF